MLEYLVKNQKEVEDKKECNKKWNGRNPTYASIKSKKWRANNPGYASAKSKEWRANNPGHCERRKAKDPERYLKYIREWQSKNRWHYQEYMAKWKAENPEYQRMWRETDTGRASVQRGHTARRDKEREIINTLTSDEWEDILKQYDYKCAYCRRSILDLPGGLVRDHVIPISRGGNNIKENVVPACRSCNSSKGVRLIEEILMKE